MIQKAFKMKLFEGKEKEYEKRHNEIWPELVKELKSHGASTYLIFHDKETNYLFSYVEMESEELWDQIAETEACKKWWEFMKDIMETNPDNSPVSIELSKVFNLK
ncbi:L-rhamnose mutarotase [Clostridium sp. DL-VIII]|uniref:L-rhamnose mutarotase n=1 Tax=Clostridium sp. DL-VIII TaxID=641107 RepID=UPI00023AF8D2|nr:L-rhamnose mutarotase [Clostridium sp. DL-VIII]EHI97509.1 L-rhamnose mutarotase [Clostridium sp. DL-VIII]